MKKGTIGKSMRELVGKRVWVVQFDDEPNRHLLMWCCGLDEGFIALTDHEGGEPTLYVNLTTVNEVDVYQEGELASVVFELSLPSGGRAILLRRDSDKPDDPDDGDVN